jgi:hypothetical protein
MLIRFRALSGHRSTLTSSVVAEVAPSELLIRDGNAIGGYHRRPRSTAPPELLDFSNVRDGPDGWLRLWPYADQQRSSLGFSLAETQ